MIATNEAADVLRHGWQDAASTLAADIPEVAELLQARLEMVIASQRLDERHLLDTIEEVESISSRAGNMASEALARRLRRTVYEYLLALDATRPNENANAELAEPAAPSEGLMVGAEEVAALGHATSAREPEGPASHTAATERAEPGIDVVEPGAATDLDGGDVDDAATPATTASRRRFVLRRRQRQGLVDAAGASGDALGAEEAWSDGEAPAVPTWQFTPAPGPDALDSEPGTEAQAPADQGAAVDATPPAGAADGNARDVQPDNADDHTVSMSFEQVAQVQLDAVDDAQAGAQDGRRVDLTEPPTEAGVEVTGEETEAGQPSPATDGEPGQPPTPSFVAPKAGFHIADDRIAPPMFEGGDDAPTLTMPVFAADELAAQESPEQAEEGATEPATSDHPGALDALDPVTTAATEAASEFLAWPTRRDRAPHAPEDTSDHGQVPPSRAPEIPAAAHSTAEQVAAAAQLRVDAAAFGHTGDADAGAAVTDPLAEEAEETQRGWSVRRHGQTRQGRPGGHVVTVPEIEDDPFENPRLAEARRRIEDKLRRKRCDEAAALLQELARETGGRVVAEFAMNAGDRCRALGKSNAALNCYLAASRSDPVYELPLSRLADICIDDKDTDLAVSYLERVARLYRYRGDEKAALRVYRRIATIAPYRDDVLALLMNAQRTGRLES